MLRSHHYQSINPWLASATEEEKRDMVALAKITEQGAPAPPRPADGYGERLPAPTAVTSKHGRLRLQGKVVGDLGKQVTVCGDRAQADLLRNRCGADVTDEALQRRRDRFSRYAAVPSTDSMNDYFRLQSQPVNGTDRATAQPIAVTRGHAVHGGDRNTAVLTEKAQRTLEHWQLTGPEASREGAARGMRALRGLNSAVAAVPSYEGHARAHGGSLSHLDVLHEFAATREYWPPRKLQASRSAPAISLNAPPPPEDYHAIELPGGYMVNPYDTTDFMGRKNRARNITSKIPVTGGAVDWSTSYKAMAKTR